LIVANPNRRSLRLRQILTLNLIAGPFRCGGRWSLVADPTETIIGIATPIASRFAPFFKIIFALAPCPWMALDGPEWLQMAPPVTYI